MDNFKGKKVFVSGGSHGIGKAIVFEFLKRGADVYYFGRNKDRVKEIKLKTRGYNGIVQSYLVDVLNIGEYVDFLDKIENLQIDILINNIGGGGRWGEEDILKTDRNVWTEVYTKNVDVAIDLTTTFLPGMVERKWGRVITISSIHGKEGSGRPWFTMAKAAEIAFMKSLSLDKKLVRNNITFNTICPGAIFIKDTGWDNREEMDKIKEEIPVGRLGTPEEVANLVLFISSTEFINGANIVIDGGESKSF